jgi:CBS domain-containing protein
MAASAEKAPVQSVTDVMSRRLLTCSPDDSLAELMAVMTEHRVRHLPVVDHGQLLGLVSIGDLVKARLGELEFESHVLRDAYLRVR